LQQLTRRAQRTNTSRMQVELGWTNSTLGPEAWARSGCSQQPTVTRLAEYVHLITFQHKCNGVLIHLTYEFWRWGKGRPVRSNLTDVICCCVHRKLLRDAADNLVWSLEALEQHCFIFIYSHGRPQVKHGCTCHHHSLSNIDGRSTLAASLRDEIVRPLNKIRTIP
jgi:hypothetical protein